MLHGIRLTALDRLRQETAGAHAAVERAFDWQGRLSTIAGYHGTLAALYGFHAAWEPYAAAVLDDPAFFDPRRRAGLLADDLRHLGGTTEGLERPALPTLATPAAALGSMYVVEGSTLGGRLIARHVAATLALRPGGGLSYHTGHGAGSGAMWRAFCARLNASLPPGSGTETEAVAAAVATFACLGRCLAGPGSAPWRSLAMTPLPG